eukprot:3472948-Lingulodinium_polyedra.AAC.1
MSTASGKKAGQHAEVARAQYVTYLDAPTSGQRATVAPASQSTRVFASKLFGSYPEVGPCAPEAAIVSAVATVARTSAV